MTIGQKQSFIINCAFIACILAIAYLVLNYLLVWLLPFVIGLAAAMFLHPIVVWISKKLHLRRRVIAPIVTLVLVSLIAILVVVGVYRAIDELGDLIAKLPLWYQNTAPAVAESIDSGIEKFIAALPDETEELLRSMVNDVITSTQSQLVAFSSNALAWIANKASSLPSLLISIIITIVATFFISTDMEEIRRFVKQQIPTRYHTQILSSWHKFGQTIGRMISSYLLIMFITFVELAIGLGVLGVPYAVAIAALTSIVDILPVLGTGTVLIPWGIIALILGNAKLGIGLLLLYVIITVVRNILEPRIIGKRIGLPALVTLIFMYLGLRVMGLFGMFLFPLAVILLKDAQDAGLVHIWKNSPDEPEDEDRPAPSAE